MPKYEMKLDLRVLDHLGIRLYSNAAAVLSEAVANAWDADAAIVKVAIAANEIVIADDGIGMGLADINGRFLNVGYDKRANEGGKSPKGRSFMGRKGIGKLALFSIAEVVDVHTVKDGKEHAFRMDTEKLKEAIESQSVYNPEEIIYAGGGQGTTIRLSELKKKRTSHTVSALRKRIARRFSIIGANSLNGDKFEVRIDDIPIGPADREDFKAIEFLWEFGDQEVIPSTSLPALKERFLIPGVISEDTPTWLVRGWMGAASQPKKLKSDEAGTMNGLVVIARGRLIQENILDRLSYSRILTSYLTGQVEADFLDTEESDDIATSDRQRLIEDDDRYVALSAFLRKSIVGIADDWTTLRNEARGKEAIEEFPTLLEWLSGLPTAQQLPARALLGVIQGVELEDEAERKQLYRCGILAFERMRLRESSHKLATISNLTAATLLPLLSDLETLEGSMYRDIVTERLLVIKQFTALVDENQKEVVLQNSLFKNLWLLDAGWERAAGSPRIEQKLKTEFKAFADGLTDDENKGRLDIRYQTNAGEHIIVELKRAKRVLSSTDLEEQGMRYRSGLIKCLETMGVENPVVTIIFVLGTPVSDSLDTTLPTHYVRDKLKLIGARIVYYDALIEGAMAAYSAYLQKSAELDKIDSLVQKLN